jgi:hypothetical protein
MPTKVRDDNIYFNDFVIDYDNYYNYKKQQYLNIKSELKSYKKVRPLYF